MKTPQSVCLVMKPYSTGNKLMPASAQTIYRSSSNPYYHPTHYHHPHRGHYYHYANIHMAPSGLLTAACEKSRIKSKPWACICTALGSDHMFIWYCDLMPYQEEKKKKKTDQRAAVLNWNTLNTSTFPLSTLVSLNWAQLWQTDVT